MRSHGVYLLSAHVDVLACRVLLRILDEEPTAAKLEALVRGLAASPDPANREAAEQVRAAVAEMRSSWALFRDDRIDRLGFVDETTKPAGRGCDAESRGESSSGHLTVAQVAERLRISPQYARRLCRSQSLSAIRRGRTWLIDATSVDEYEAARSSVA
jgi:excisionase family DNA binding protein